MRNSAIRKSSSFLKNLFLLTMPGLIFTLLLLELFFRFVIPATEVPSVYFDPTDEILRYDTKGRTEGIATLGKWGEGPVRWRINNYGWNSEIDYAPAEGAHRPLLALIGDSYIDALQVDIADNIAAQTRRALRGRYQVYSFGIGGAPLSQYLLMSRYVRRHFQPRVMVFNIVHNDFDESLVELENMPYFLELSFQDGGFKEVPPRHYQRSTFKGLCAKSALVRYLWFNLRLNSLQVWPLVKRGGAAFDANIDVIRVQRYRETIEKATYYLVQKIRDENPGVQIIFMMDAPRNDIYAGNPASTRLLWMYRLLRNACTRSGCAFIDLTQPFVDEYRRTGVKFNFDSDFHWNAVGHRLAAQVLAKRLREMGILDSDGTAGK